MKQFWLGFILGSIIFGAAAAYAATRFTLINGSGQELGTTANPMFVTLN